MSVVARQVVGVEEEFSAYFRRYYNAVVRYVERRVAQPEDAAELVADVFRVAWLRFDPANAASRAWLFRVAHNMVLDHYRRTGRQRALIARVVDDTASQAAPLPSPIERENPVLVALEGLDEPAREVL
ncbi:MAG: sigma-70 family RNA polymerase sigma factor, partial [Propionibacteriaceae bacterium]|nr:sigma-70 family RNA polymerase sigma factor [Propionibacteriaceae bacterium]